MHGRRRMDTSAMLYMRPRNRKGSILMDRGSLRSLASLLALSQGDEGGRAAAACMSVRLRGRDTDEVVVAEHVDGVAEKAVLAGGDVSEVRRTYRNGRAASQ